MGKIKPKKKTGVCATHQRMITREVKRTRFLALLP
jgi:small subunit ribosomal protein S18